MQNPLKPNDPGLRELLETIEWINSFPSPGTRTARGCCEIAQDEGDDAPSRLGLVRIAFEGNCTVEATVDGGTVTVTARMQLA